VKEGGMCYLSLVAKVGAGEGEGQRNAEPQHDQLQQGQDRHGTCNQVARSLANTIRGEGREAHAGDRWWVVGGGRWWYQKSAGPK
jgi:hypothetical protein